MIEFSIEKERTSIVSHVQNFLNIRGIGIARPPAREIPTYMPKLQYAIWIEGIKKQFPIGTLVTYKSVAEAASVVNLLVFTVKSIEEIHWNAPIDRVHNEPECLFVQGERTNIPIRAVPGILRPLTMKELELVAIRDKETTPEYPLTTTTWPIQEISVGGGRNTYRNFVNGEEIL